MPDGTVARVYPFHIDVETPANGGLFANAKISAEALKALTENTESED